jgi:PAS domain S-box-containing protein
MFIIDSEQTIVAWNSTAERLFGITGSDAIGKKCYDVLPTDDSTGRSTCKQDCFVIRNAHRSRLTRDFDINVKDKSGQVKLLNMSILLPPSRGGNKEVIHLFRDVTDRRAVEAMERELASAAVPNADSSAIPPLTRREDQVMRLLGAGKNTGEIANALGIKPLTARNHVTRLLTKLNCSSRLEAVALANRAGFI